jgi:predicted transposase/invertase (TIGR01784 family)
LPDLVAQLLIDAKRRPDSKTAAKAVELLEELLIRRFDRLDREEIRRMFQLHDLRKTRVWQEAREEGIEKGIEEGIEEGIEKERAATIRKLLARGDDPKTVARTLEITVAEVRRLAKRQPE